MKLTAYGDRRAWTVALLSSKHEAVDVPSWGLGLLYYGPDRRLGISIWGLTWSRYFQLTGKEGRYGQ